MVMELKPGELVDLQVRGAVVVEHDTPELTTPVLVVRPRNWADDVVVPFPWNGVQVDRVAPAQWPPQPGDLWRDSGGEMWFCELQPPRADNYGPLAAAQEKMRPARPAPDLSADSLLADRGPLTLVFRDGVTVPSPGEPVAEPDRRGEYIAGLHELADWLAAHPSVPLPLDRILLCLLADDDEAGAAALGAVADEMGVEVEPPGVPRSVASHYDAVLSFGGVKLHAYYIPQAEKRQGGES